KLITTTLPYTTLFRSWPHVNPKSLKRQAITSGHSGHLGVRQLKDDQDDFPKATTSPTSAESKAPRRIQKHFIHQGHCLNCSFGQDRKSTRLNSSHEWI